MRKKFKILYPHDHYDPNKRGQKYKPPEDEMLVMNSDGVFFLYSNETYYPSIRKLSDVLEKYDVVWND